MRKSTRHFLVALSLSGVLLSGCLKRKYNAGTSSNSEDSPKCQIPVAVGQNLFDQNVELGDFPDKENIVKTPDLPPSFRAELVNQFFHSMYWSTTVLHQQGGFDVNPASIDAGAGATSSGPTLSLTSDMNATNAPLVLERIIVTKDASTEIAGSIKLEVSGGGQTRNGRNVTVKAGDAPENGFSFNYVREPYFIYYKLVTNPNVPFNCNGKERRFQSSKVFPGNVKSKVEVNRNITLALNVSIGVDTALEMTGVPPPIADVLVKFLNVKGSVDGKFVVKDPIAHEMTYRGRTSSGLSKYEHSVAKNVLQPLCSFVLRELGENKLNDECEMFLPGIPDPATDLKDMVNPKRKNLVYPITSCSVAGRSGLFNLYALSVRVPADYEPNAEQVSKNLVRFNVFKREQENANATVAAWTNQNAWVTLKAVGGDTSCLDDLKEGKDAYKCAVVELGQNILGAAFYPKFECLCARIGDGNSRRVSRECRLKGEHQNLRVAANYAISESKDRVAYPQPEPKLEVAPVPAQAQAPAPADAPDLSTGDVNTLPPTTALP